MQGKKKILYTAVSGITVLLTIGILLSALFVFNNNAHAVKAASSTPQHIDCGAIPYICTDVGDSQQIFGYYTGHDEPATLFYSNQPGSGNRARFRMTLPKDPSAANPLTPWKSFNFQLHPTFWVSMILCDTQSYPVQVSTCTPNSDKNIVDPTVSTQHPGTAVMELQLYPPGWVAHPNTFNSCDATRWCAALNIDSLSVNPVAGTLNNSACLAAAGEEPVNFAFLTKNGKTQPNSPPSPLLSTNQTFTPDLAADLFMNSGDNLAITMHDSAHGLVTQIDDLTTHQSGSMTASATNGFAQTLFDPTGIDCNPATHNIPYDFHPMYSTSSEKTSAIWAAHTLNVAFSDEIGHWDYCQGANAITAGGNCPAGNTEGNATDSEPTDADDSFCFPASASPLVQVPGCISPAGNAGFDGNSYQTDWPDGSPLHPTAVQFSSPQTGQGYNIKYNRIAFETDTPALEPGCNTHTGAGCQLLPQTDEAQPVAFYPFFSIRGNGGNCRFQLGNHIPGSKNDFGQNNEWGQLLQVNSYLFGGGGAPRTRYFDFRQTLNNPCAG